MHQTTSPETASNGSGSATAAPQTDDDAFNDRMHHLADSYVRFCVDTLGPVLIPLAQRRHPDVPLYQIGLPHIHGLCFTLRAPDGFLLDRFCDVLTDVTEEERGALRRFREVRPGTLYEVQYCEGRALRVLDLEEQRYLTLRTRPVTQAAPHLQPRALLVLSVVPLRDAHTHIGPLRVIRKEERRRLERLEARLLH